MDALICFRLSNFEIKLPQGFVVTWLEVLITSSLSKAFGRVEFGFSKPHADQLLQLFDLFFSHIDVGVFCLLLELGLLTAGDFDFKILHRFHLSRDDLFLKCGIYCRSGVVCGLRSVAVVSQPSLDGFQAKIRIILKGRIGGDVIDQDVHLGRGSSFTLTEGTLSPCQVIKTIGLGFSCAKGSSLSDK